jgi:D-serine deaminase-like pyridoxal phosphate-dependent protein
MAYDARLRGLPASLDALQTPCLLVELSAVRHNVAAMRRWLDGDFARWRPHVKTSKIPEILDLLLEAGVRHFKCATTREAETLLARAEGGIDLLVAMAHHGANLARLRELARQRPGHRLSVLTEDERHARAVADGGGLGVFVDLDPGYQRSGIALDDGARIAAVAAAAGGALRGLHCYEGHLRGDAASRARGCTEVYGRLADVAAGVAAGRGGDFEVVTSGTPAFPFAVREPRLRAFTHRVSPGTVVYWDQTSADLGIDGFRFAVTVLTTVISAPAADRVTCDAGSKAVDAACGDPCAFAEGLPWLRAQTPSEEHLPLHRCAAGPMPETGTRLRLVPRHVCPTVNLAGEAVLLEDDRIVAVVPVRARGHEVWAPRLHGADAR